MATANLSIVDTATAVVVDENAFTIESNDPDLADDLGALGVSVSTPVALADLDQTRRDAIASVLLKRRAEAEAEVAQLQKSRDLEIQFIAHRYGADISRLDDRVRTLTMAVEAIAFHTKLAGGYSGKKKSRDVGAGSYGYRSYASTVKCDDEASYIAWAETNAPDTLRVKPAMTLATAREYLTATELADTKREVMKNDVAAKIATDPETLPPGWARTPSHDEFFAKPLPLAAI